jgi:ABC-type sugar transport system ATPase subunit
MLLFARIKGVNA